MNTIIIFNNTFSSKKNYSIFPSFPFYKSPSLGLMKNHLSSAQHQIVILHFSKSPHIYSTILSSFAPVDSLMVSDCDN